jgi:uncharacterized protein (TIGR02147 family)
MSSELPTPYDYLDYRGFLADWFAAKKAANPRYSYRVFARRAGGKSPSLLHHVIDGRRNLTPSALADFVVALGLRAGEAQFFRLLVELDQAKDADARNAVWERVAATRRFREARRIDVSAFAYLSNWAMPAIRELASRSDFRADAAWVADQLRPRITVGEASKALQQLQDLGYLVQDGDRLVPAEASVATPPEVAGLAVRNYHRGMLARAAESMERFDHEERHLLAVTVGVPDALIPVLKAEATAFLERMMHLCDASADDNDRVVQMNLQIFPLSAGREES